MISMIYEHHRVAATYSESDGADDVMRVRMENDHVGVCRGVSPQVASDLKEWLSIIERFYGPTVIHHCLSKIWRDRISLFEKNDVVRDIRIPFNPNPAELRVAKDRIRGVEHM